MSGEDDGDATYELIQRGLFVQNPTRTIHLNTVPLDGNEFIMKSKLEETDVCYTRIEDLAIVTPQEKEQRLMRQHAVRCAKKFSEYAQILTNEREFLKKKFPRKVAFPDGGIKDWCLFCLGSEVYFKIYGEKKPKQLSEEVGHPPLRSIIVHLNQPKVIMILKYLYDWFLRFRMKESLGMWMYALLACLNKPLDENSKKFLECFYNICEIRMKDSKEFEMSHLYQISAILEYNFLPEF